MKQIRVQVDNDSYNVLKREAKELRMNLEHYAGLKLSGYQIIRPKQQEVVDSAQ